MLSSRSKIYLVLFSWLIILVCFINTAWVSDDAFISFRAVRNFLDGFGPVWNIGERVQVFTHPLWFIALSAVSVITGEQYYASLFLSAICLLGVAFVVFQLADGVFVAMVASVVVALSRTFMDYSSSGLENPLTHCLLALLVWRFFVLDDRPGFRSILLILALAALLVLNRLDLALLAGPFVVATLWRARALSRLDLGLALVIAGLPLLVWFSFATYYYGSPLPNTSFAKLATGIPVGDLWRQGIAYAKASAMHDVPSFLVVLLALFCGLYYPIARVAWVSLMLYLMYSLSIGGDFMVGRFYSALFLLALLLLLCVARARPRFGMGIAPVSLAFLVNVPVTLLSPPAYANYYISAEGIADERGYYNRDTGLRRNLGRESRYFSPYAQAGLSMRGVAAPVFESCYVGMLGYYARKDAFIVDAYGLTDPLLARLPALLPWRIGHFERPAPKGYYDIVRGVGRMLEDPELDALWRDLYLAHRAPLDEPGRLSAIWRLHNGAWRHHIDKSQELTVSAKRIKPTPYHCRDRIGLSVRALDASIRE